MRCIHHVPIKITYVSSLHLFLILFCDFLKIKKNLHVVLVRTANRGEDLKGGGRDRGKGGGTAKERRRG